MEVEQLECNKCAAPKEEPKALGGNILTTKTEEKGDFLSLSSAKHKIELDHESNSIITEEESAFEENLSPKTGKKNRENLQENMEYLDSREQYEPVKMRAIKANQPIAGNSTYRDTEKLEVDYRVPVTKEEKKKFTANLPLKRSTTQREKHGAISP